MSQSASDAAVRTGRCGAVCLALVLSGATVSQMAAQGQGPADGIDISLRIAREIVLNEPLVAEFVIRNDGDSPIQVELGWDRIGAFEFTLVSPTGRSSDHRAAVRDGLSRSSVVEIDGRSTLSHRIVVGEAVEFPSPGIYRLQVRFSGAARRGNYSSPFRLREGVRPWTRVWQTDITVRERDPERLRGRCEELFRSAMDKQNADRRTSALALASVRDPLAIPYLVKLIQSDFQSPLINAIARIGGGDAMAALELLSASSDRAVAANATQALERLRLGLPTGPVF